MANLLNELAEVSKYLTEEARDQRLADIVEEAMSELAAGTSDKEKWVPVNEGLPKYTDTFLVWVGINQCGEGMHMECRTAMFYYPMQRFYVHREAEGELVSPVSMWMPLPKPPEEG